MKGFFVSKSTPLEKYKKVDSDEDRWWLERREHNGSEWWEYKSSKLSRLEMNRTPLLNDIIPEQGKALNSDGCITCKQAGEEMKLQSSEMGKRRCGECGLSYEWSSDNNVWMVNKAENVTPGVSITMAVYDGIQRPDIFRIRR
jgi:hypothetical protein